MRFKKILAGVMVAMLCFNVGNLNALAAEKDYAAIAAAYDKTTYDKNDLGATYTSKSTTFKVWSPTAKLVKVKLYTKGSNAEKDCKVLSTTLMNYDYSTGVWSVTVKGDLKNMYYTYLVSNGLSEYETVDIYAKAAGVNGNRGMIVDLKSTNPDGWENDTHILAKSQSDAIVWEVQIKDFSYSSSSGVSAKNRGKYLAFTEQNTTLNAVEGNPSTCIAYLKELGVTHVQINPFYDFGSIDETGSDSQYNWGYDPKNYNVPEGSFSSNPYDGNVRIKECKEMIKALHDAGIGVIMDVVYNHTFENEGSWFHKTVPNYYYRMNSDGTWSNGSGCGNDTASEHKMFRKFMIDSVLYWATEYHIDGFRFDLMGLHDVDTMNDIRASLDKLENGEKILMYGEAWTLETASKADILMANQNNMSKLSERIGAFNDGIRDALKGSVFEAKDGGFLQKGSSKTAFKTGIQGQSVDGWATTPQQTVTFVSCHDNYTLYDKLVSSVFGTDADYRARKENLVSMNKLAGASILTSQGMSFFLAGEEMARSKDGDENSFKSNVSLNMIDWKNITAYSDIVEYYKGLIKIRKTFAPFSDSTAKSANNIKFFENAEKSIVGYTLEDPSETKSWKKVAVIFNSNNEKSVDVKIEGDNLPSKWVIVANDQTAGVRNLGEISGSSTVQVKPSSAVILVDKDSYKSANIEEKQGLVVSNFYDNSTGELITQQVLSGDIGSQYSVEINNTLALNYDVKSVSGAYNGKFKNEITQVTYKCKKYEGKFSKVTIKYVDEESGKSIYDEILIKNRSGQQYNTPYIPTISGYALNMDKLPENGSGKLQDTDTTVTYTYKKAKAAKESECIVYALYMDNNGKILDKIKLTGKSGENYKTEQRQYTSLELVNSVDNAKGKFTTTEKYVLYSYTIPIQEQAIANDQQVILIVCVIVAFLLACGGVTATVLTHKKKSIREELQIDDL